MLLPLSWLKEYIMRLPNPAALAEVLMMHGLEVESVIDRSNDFDNVVVGEIVAIRPHPNADKLRLADVVVTPGGKPQEIVCGAPNIMVGQKAPVALLGAKLPNGLTIEKRAIRGVESNGMLCAADELGLGKDRSGIIILDPALKVGTPLVKAMGLDEVVFDLAIPANRADLMAVRGLAWEIGAILGQKVNLPPSPSPSLKKEGRSGSPSASVTVKVADPKLAPVYTARVIHGVKIQPSPAWLQNRLRAAGMRPINVVVDITNYIMLEYGQPLHAFDAAKVKNSQVDVRPAKAGELLTTLDGQARKLDSSMIVIADAAGPIALAGVMGGINSEVTSQTTDIILESAIFHPVAIRKTSRKLGLLSEASKRFEKGLWSSLPLTASAAAARLIVEYCGGTVEPQAAVVGTVKTKPRIITMPPKYVTERLGVAVAPAKSKTILTKLGFGVTGAANWKVAVPEWRLDVATPEDVVDEIGRMIGYDHLPHSIPLVPTVPQPLPRMIKIKEEVRDILAGLGFTEVMTHAYYGGAAQKTVGGEHIEVANPLDKQQQYLRRSLVPAATGILSAAADAGHDEKVFELGRIFEPGTINITERQPWRLVIGLSTSKSAGYIAGTLVEKYHQEFFKAMPSLERVPSKNTLLEQKGKVIEICEFDLNDILKTQGRKTYRDQSKFPKVKRDISVFLPAGLSYETIVQKILALPVAETALLERESISYDPSQVNGKTSFLFHFVLWANDHTLTKSEIDATMARLEAALKALGATIR